MNISDQSDKIQHGKKWMPAMYVAYFGILQEIANEHGYALCVHGSVIRDFDLIAVPFDEVVKPRVDLLNAIRKVVGLEKSSNEIFYKVGHQPHGRICYTIECGGGGYFDISFTPSLQDAINTIEDNLKKKTEINEIIEKSR